MEETGINRFSGSLDPRAQEYRPRHNNLNNFTPHITTLLGPPPLPHQVYYPYPPQAVPFNDFLGFPQYRHIPPAYVHVAPFPPLPPPGAPTRTLVLSSVPREVGESLVRRELEVFGEVRGVQMERVSDGIVTVHFYDLRHAEKALMEIREQHMQNQARLRNHFMITSERLGLIAPPPPPPLPARGLIAGCVVWAQFIIPSYNAIPDGHNQGTLVVFNLDPHVPTRLLKEIFRTFGDLKELRETPLKKQQRFVEFYDVRDAAKALREMNGKEIYGKLVDIEFSRPGGFGKKFFNANASSKNSTPTLPVINSPANIRHGKISTHLPPPPSPPLLRRFSSPPCSPPSISSTSFIESPSSAGKKPSTDSSEGNPNEALMQVSLGCLSLGGAVGGGMVENVANHEPQKRSSSSKKSQSNQSSFTIIKQPRKSTKPWKGRQAKKSDTRFHINEDSIVGSSGSDYRTTVMIKNIPNKYSQKLLLNMLDNHCIHCNEQLIDDGDDQPLSSYDFVYLPIDFNNKCNMGYGFVNMTSPQAAWRLYKAFHDQHWEVFNSRKICAVTYARVQGLEALKEHFKNSKFPCEMDHYLPVVFCPPRDGRQLTEPLPIVGHKQYQLQQQPISSVVPSITSTDHEIDGGDDDDSLKSSNNGSGGDIDQLVVNLNKLSNIDGGGDIDDDDEQYSSSSYLYD